VVITVAEPESNFPDLDEQRGEVLWGRVNHTAVACREHLDFDSTRGVTVGGSPPGASRPCGSRRRA
jgi:hypothetical protein